MTIADFKRPLGRLDPAWFQGDLDATLTALLTQAEGLTSIEAAQTAWVYHRAYSLLADDAMARPSTEAADDVRETFADAQLLHWQRLATDFLTDYQVAAGAFVGGPVLQPIGYEP